MKTYHIFFSLYFVLTGLTLSQNLFIPYEIKNAYEKHSRSYDGTPGPNYWQNNSEYKIKISIDPASRVLTGEEQIKYNNNSPDSLSKLVIKLQQDIYRYDAPRDFSFSKSSLNNGVHISLLAIDGDEIDLENNLQVSRTGTNLIINLPEKKSKGIINIKVSWDFIIPNKDQIRMGAYGDSAFFVAYWYPEMAVLDDIDGWDLTSYTGTAEFYHDFSDYDVEIALPRNFTVWSTGILQNPEQIFSEKYLHRYLNALKSDTLVKIISPADLKDEIYLDKERIIWHYKAEKVPDFAFGIGYKYLWDGLNVVVDEATNRKVFVSAAYKPSSQDFYKVAAIAAATVKGLSTDEPGVPFPYPRITVFNGRGGMEFPMIVNDGSATEWRSTVHVTSHEISHTYFPFYMGINERKYGFMDEGWAVMLPSKIQSDLVPFYNPDSNNTFYYNSYAGKELEVPPMMLSYILKGNTYRNAAYYRPAAAYHILMDMLGKEKFNSVLKEYIRRWNGKHPMPYDFFFTFNNFLNINLNWFWEPWFFKDGFPDLSIKDVKVDDDKVTVKIERTGTIPLPVMVTIVYKDGRKEVISKKPDIWYNGDKEISLVTLINGELQSLMLGRCDIPDINKDDNQYLFK